MDVKGLAAEWDAISSIRDRLRDGRKLFEHPQTQKWCEPTRENCVRNSDALAPILKRLQVTSGRTLPHLDPLQNENQETLCQSWGHPGGKDSLHYFRGSQEACWICQTSRKPIASRVHKGQGIK